MKNAALAYLKKGLSIVPSGGGKDRKAALVKWKEFQTRLPTEAEVTGWWTEWPNANIAVVTGKISNLTVLDIDRTVHDDPTSPLPYHDDLPKTLVARTGGKGLHYFYRYSERASKVRDGKLRQGIEIKSDGSLITLPPSLHGSNEKYEWLNKKPIALFPDDFIYDEMIRQSGSRFDATILKGVTDGGRNISAASLAGKLLRMGASFDEAFIFMQVWDALNSPPLGETVIRKTLESISKFHPKKEANLVSFTDLLQESIAELDATRPEDCISFGYSWLDDKLTGLFPGELAIVGGESGTGKTSFVTNIVYKTSRKGTKCAVFALEDRLEDYGIKAVYFEMGRLFHKNGMKNYPWNAYRKNEIRDVNYPKIRAEAQKNLENTNLYFARVEEQMNIELLEKIIETACADGYKLFVIDHLHYFDLLRSESSKADYIEQVMVRIKTLQNKTGARIIMVVHYKKLEGKKPMLDSFKDSISIVQNANYVLNLWRDRKEQDEFSDETELYVPKSRNPNGEATFKMRYDRITNDYELIDRKYGSPQPANAQSSLDDEDKKFIDNFNI